MKLNVTATGLAFGVFWAIGIIGVTVISGLTNSPEAGEYTGYGASFIRGIMSVYPGYNISPMGALIGGAWALADGFISGAVLACLYNFFSSFTGKADGSASCIPSQKLHLSL